MLACNQRLRLGLRRGQTTRNSASHLQDVLETCPYWTSKVTKLKSTLVLCEDEFFFAMLNNPLHARNIVANAGNLFSI